MATGFFRSFNIGKETTEGTAVTTTIGLLSRPYDIKYNPNPREGQDASVGDWIPKGSVKKGRRPSMNASFYLQKVDLELLWLVHFGGVATTQLPTGVLAYLHKFTVSDVTDSLTYEGKYSGENDYRLTGIKAASLNISQGEGALSEFNVVLPGLTPTKAAPATYTDRATTDLDAYTRDQVAVYVDPVTGISETGGALSGKCGWEVDFWSKDVVAETVTCTYGGATWAVSGTVSGNQTGEVTGGTYYFMDAGSNQYIVGFLITDSGPSPSDTISFTTTARKKYVSNFNVSLSRGFRHILPVGDENPVKLKANNREVIAGTLNCFWDNDADVQFDSDALLDDLIADTSRGLMFLWIGAAIETISSVPYPYVTRIDVEKALFDGDIPSLNDGDTDLSIPFSGEMGADEWGMAGLIQSTVSSV